jgi:Bacterial conjugation TrbI-like protein
MFSKPLAFVLLALGCLTAAAGGAYVATRHNMSEMAARPAAAAPAALASPATGQPAATPSRAVAETEAPVTVATADPAPAPAAAAPAPVHAEAPVPVHAEAPVPAAHAAAPVTTTARAAEPARVPAPRPAPRTPVEPAAPSHTARTVPMTNAGAPVTQPDSTTPPQASAPAPAAAPSVRAGEPVKMAEDPLPEPPRAPQYDELILPAAAVIGLQVETSLNSERARIEDRVDARVSRDVMVAGRVAIPAGSRVIGSVTTVDRGGKMKEQARLGIRFHTLVLADGTSVQLRTDPVYRLGEDPTAGSTKKIGGAAIGGAIIGAILGGGKGAAIGGAAGAGAGSAAVMSGDRNPANIRQGEYLNVKLSSPATITVERREE